MPEEVFGVMIIAIIAGSTLLAVFIRSLFGYLRARNGVKASGPSLTQRELEGLIRRAVEEATQPLVEQIDRLERRLEAADAEHEVLALPKQTEEEALWTAPAKKQATR